MLLTVAVMAPSYWVYNAVVSSACLHVRADTPDRSWHSSKVAGFSSSALLSPLASLAKRFTVTALFQGNSEKLLSPCSRHMALWHSSSAPLCPALCCVKPKGCCFLSPGPIVSLNMNKWGRNLKGSQGNKSVNEFRFQCKVICSQDRENDSSECYSDVVLNITYEIMCSVWSLLQKWDTELVEISSSAENQMENSNLPLIKLWCICMLSVVCTLHAQALHFKKGEV